MSSDIRKYLHYLQSGHVTEDGFLETLDSFFSLSSRTAVVSDNMRDMADLFYNIIRVCGRIYKGSLECDRDGISDVVKERVFIGFGNIEHLYIEATLEDEKSSSISLIRFLSELKAKKDKQKSPDINRQFLEKNIEVLLDVLNDVSYIFDATYKGEILFPINSIVASVIGNKGFITGARRLNEKDIKLLQLAVRLFQNDSEELVVLLKLKEKCNLKFIDYLGSGGHILDTSHFDNYRSNGTMIFHDSVRRCILIRNADKGYFDVPDRNKYEVKPEYDYEGNTFCWFVEYGLGNRTLNSYSQIQGNKQFAKNLLKLLYNEKKRNVFINNAIMMDDYGNIDSVNPFCCNDKFLIKEVKIEKAEVRPSSDAITEMLGEYRACSIKDNIMNRLTIGICSLLLDINNVGVDALGIDSLQNGRWYQEQVIQNWMNHDSLDDDSRQSLLYNWYNQLRYCESDKSFESYELKQQDFLPLQQSLDGFMQLIAPHCYDGEYIFAGIVEEIVEENEDTSYEINVSLMDTISGKRYRSTSGNRSMVVSCGDLEDITEDIEWERLRGQKLYFTYSPVEAKGHIADQPTTKLLAGLEHIMFRALPFEVGNEVSDYDLQRAYDVMSMYRKAYCDYARRKKVFSTQDFETQAYMRLLHNLIWSRVNSKTVHTYFDVIRGHMIAGFEDIAEDAYFSNPEYHSLYIMKDNMHQNAVMSDVYSTYIKDGGHRDMRPLYYKDISIDGNGKYTFCGNVIKKIVFLTDNFIFGDSTIASLAAYYGLTADQIKDYVTERRYKEAEASIESITCNGEPVSISEIIARNGHLPVSIHGFYGTDKGIERIKQFLDKVNICYDCIDYYHEMDRPPDGVPEMANSIWKNAGEGKAGRYLLFREFSLPKSTVFPNKMLSINDGDINRAICMYVKRKELNLLSRTGN